MTETSPPRWPRAPGFDATRALLREGYDFGRHRFERLRSDVFETRLGLRRVMFVRGAEAAAMFYAPDRFTRHGAIPPTTLRLLQDVGSVQRLEGDAHRHRKAMFLSILGIAGTARLVTGFREECTRGALAWAGQDAIVLRREAALVLCRTACRWAGVPLSEDEAARRARDLDALVEGAGALGPRLWRGWQARRRTERWIRGVIRLLRRMPEQHDTPAAAIAWHRDARGVLLEESSAAVELINLLRPIVAIAVWITFVAHALHVNPDIRERLRAGERGLTWRFVQEVRRFYPFFPAIAGRVRTPFEWRGRRFREGETVMLDLYASDHDPARWVSPERFEPDRFIAWPGSAFELIPQGAGEAARTHRCPGEEPSIALLMAAVDFLVNRVDYDVPPQPLDWRRNRFPAVPESGMRLRHVRLRTA
ncbi:MAG TPA: cytochrome P450 [Lysobacter sp.]